MNYNKVKILVILVLLILFSLQILTFAYEEGNKKEKYLFKEKMAALKVNAILAEKEGNKEEIIAQYNLLAEACEETAKTPFVSDKVKRQARRLLAESMMKLDEYDEAIQICDELLEENSGDKATLRVKANIYWEQGKNLSKEEKYNSAIKKYKEIIDWDIKPELDAFFKYNIAYLYLQQGKKDIAKSWYKKIINEHSDLLNWPACACYSLAELYQSQDNIKIAKKYYKRIISNYPKSSWVAAANEEIEIINSKDREK